MGVKVINTKSENELNPGESKEYYWKHISPIEAVWTANAFPLTTGSTKTGFAQTTELEVTRTWRKFTVVEKSKTQFSEAEIDSEFHYVVKNIGSTKARFIVYLCVCS